MDELTPEILSKLSGTVTARALKEGIEIRVFMPYREKPKKETTKALKALDSKALRLASILFDNAKNYLPPIKESDINKKLESWASDIEKIHRIDGIDYSHIETILYWSIKDAFWFNKILSGSKFRKQFPTLWAQAKGAYEKNKVEEI